jgi:hypothetical protein
MGALCRADGAVNIAVAGCRDILQGGRYVLPETRRAHARPAIRAACRTASSWLSVSRTGGMLRPIPPNANRRNAKARQEQ